MSPAISPKAKVWRKKGEGLTVTGKGTKDLSGENRLHLIVVIADGKGVVLREPYEKMTRFFCATIYLLLLLLLLLLHIIKVYMTQNFLLAHSEELSK